VFIFRTESAIHFVGAITEVGARAGANCRGRLEHSESTAHDSTKEEKMKNFTMNMIFAAAVLSGASAARADNILRAEVPFPFSMSGKEFSPGKYEVQSDGRFQLILRNRENSGGGLAAFTSELLPQNAADGKSKLVFACTDGACVLVDVVDSGKGVRLSLPLPKNHKGSPARMDENKTRVTVNIP
jgi:hypothetical protein